MKIIKTKDVLSFDPCARWTKKRLQKLDPEDKGLTPLQICDLDINTEDILWLLLRPEIIPENDLHELACIFAERALRKERKAGREPSQASWEAIAAKRKWLKKEINDSELKEKRDAAAADAAAADAAADAAYAAADDAADADAAASDADAAASDDNKNYNKTLKDIIEYGIKLIKGSIK